MRTLLTYDAPPAPSFVPVPGDVLRDEDTGALRRIEAIRPVSRGPNVGVRFVLEVTRITAAEVPAGAELIDVSRIRRR